jgi:DNA-binding NarL/FixJ family response regulator
MNARRPIRLCIVEDHSLVRAGLKLLLASNSDMEVAGEAFDRRGALEVAAREQPDVLLLDIQLGQESALDFIEELLAVCSARAILLTGSANEEQIFRAIQAGVKGLVFKAEDPDVLIQAVRKVHGGDVWLTRGIVTAALSRFHSTRPSGKPNPEISRIAALTAREREIVALAAKGHNRRAIAAKLFVSEGTVRNHLTSIFEKLELPNQLGLVFFAQRHGLDKTPVKGGAARP